MKILFRNPFGKKHHLHALRKPTHSTAVPAVTDLVVTDSAETAELQFLQRDYCQINAIFDWQPTVLPFSYSAGRRAVRLFE